MKNVSILVATILDVLATLNLYMMWVCVYVYKNF